MGLSPPIPPGPFNSGWVAAVPDTATLTALQRDRLRLVATIETQEKLEATRRFQDVEDLRNELAGVDVIDAAIEGQRQLLVRAAKKRF